MVFLTNPTICSLFPLCGTLVGKVPGIYFEEKHKISSNINLLYEGLYIHAKGCGKLADSLNKMVLVLKLRKNWIK